MSKYTTEVRYICETSAGLSESKGYNDIESIIATAAPIIFGDNNTANPATHKFPIYDENHRLELETKILRHYYTREICEETVGLWKLRLIDKLNLIMPYYNKLYESAEFEFDPLRDVDTTRITDGSYVGDDTHTRTTATQLGAISTESRQGGEENRDINTENRTAQNNYADVNSGRGTSSSNSTQLDLYSDTPQGGIEGLEGITGQNASDPGTYYLTNARKITDAQSGESQDNTTASGHNEESANSSRVGDSERTVHYTNTTTKSGGDTTTETLAIDDNHTNHDTERYFGKQGGRSYSSMLMEYRETILNIDLMIVEELSDLFMRVW